MTWSCNLLLATSFIVSPSASPTSDAARAAIAVVPREGVHFYGFGEGATRSEAQQNALQRCDDERCVVVQEYRQGQCAVMVLGRKQIFWAGGGPESIEDVRLQLVDQCSRIDDGCRVILQQCQSPWPGP